MPNAIARMKTGEICGKTLTLTPVEAIENVDAQFRSSPEVGSNMPISFAPLIKGQMVIWSQLNDQREFVAFDWQPLE